MDIVNLVGRIVLAAFVIHSGLGHFRDVDTMASYTAAKGVPLPRLSVIVSGIVLVLGGLSVALGAWTDIGALVLAVFLVAAAVCMHDFWTQQDPAAKTGEQIHFVKNIGLAAAMLIIFASFAATGDAIGLTLTDPLINS